MAKILFIRHGQASFFKDNYDELSSKGRQQAEALQKYFQETGIPVHHFFSGNLNRQIDTKTIIAESYTEVPKSIDSSFNEHHGPKVVRNLWPKEVPKTLDEKEKRSFMKGYFRFFEQTTKAWVLGELEAEPMPEIEPWEIFKNRVHAGLDTLFQHCQKGETLAVVTSGGPVAVAAGYALNLSDEKIIELSWNIANSSVTEFLYSQGRFSLINFNTTPHLVKTNLKSLV
ncbi:MAG: histidine phosphatase family protein [Bacteroidota bacterium]